MGFIIQEVLFNVKTQPILLKRLRLSGFIAHDKPVLLAVLGTTQSQMDRTIPLLGAVDMMPEERLARSQREALHFAAALPLPIDPKAPCEANAPMPPQLRQMCHAMRVGKPPIRAKPHVTADRKHLCHLIQYRF